MNRLRGITTLAALACSAAIVLFYMCSPGFPRHWHSLAVGDTIPVAKAKVPELHLDSKDGGLNRWYDAESRPTYLGIEYVFTISATFDENGRLSDVDGHSGNKISGLFDVSSPFRIP